MSDGGWPRGGGQRELRKLATRTRLREAATGLARKSGAEHVTIDEICAEAGVSRRTFFNHFKVKEEAFLVWDDEDDQQMVRAIVDRPAQESALRAALIAMHDLLFEPLLGHGGAQVRGVIASHPDLLTQATMLSGKTERAIAIGVARRTGAPAEEAFARLVAATVLAALRALSHLDSEATGTGRTQTLEEICRILEQGFQREEAAMR
ncbi:TetR/AcrR family transcriptional regulator [Streptomyces sp. NPDC055037]